MDEQITWQRHALHYGDLPDREPWRVTFYWPDGRERTFLYSELSAEIERLSKVGEAVPEAYRKALQEIFESRDARPLR